MKVRKWMQILVIMMVMTISGLALVGCGGGDGKSDVPEVKDEVKNDAGGEKDNEPTDDNAGQTEGEGSFAYAGEYTLVDGDITYVVTVEANEDYEMQVIREFDGFTATKYYAGPMKNINGAHMATMPVFLSDLVYEGDGAPEDAAEVYEKMNEVYTSTRGETEESRMFYVTMDKENMTFVCDEGQSITLDPTEGYWIASDFAE